MTYVSNIDVCLMIANSLNALCRCEWKLTSDGSPNCTFPAPYGYRLDGDDPQISLTGFHAKLSRIQKDVTLFSKDATSLIVNVTFETENRLHIKVYFLYSVHALADR